MFARETPDQAGFAAGEQLSQVQLGERFAEERVGRHPAASLVHYLRPGTPIYLIDPNTPDLRAENLHIIREPASTGVSQVVEELVGAQSRG